MPEVKTILVCPLNWGIGHASRCIPIISIFLSAGHKVVIAADGKTLALLKTEFPDLDFEFFPGYDVVYSKKIPMAIKMGMEAPKIIRSIAHEQKFIQQIIEKHSVDALISDNRFGAYSKKIPSIFITHQLFIQTPGLLSPLKPIIKFLNFRYIKKFDQVWVPDFRDEPSLSAKLSHGNFNRLKVKYIGPLSRFSKVFKQSETAENPPDLLVLLSGPEPQRSILENILINKLSYLSYNTWIIRGLPGDSQNKKSTVNLKFFNHLDPQKLGFAIKESKFIIARAGYSTIMDLYVLGKNALLIPTPGQTEQEYLAHHLNKMQMFTFIKQDKIDLSSLEISLKKLDFIPFQKMYDLEKIVNDWILTI
jgi:uncharacterized protein (TIGR00661 family)